MLVFIFYVYPICVPIARFEHDNMDLRGHLNVIYAFQSIIKTLLSFQRKFKSINLSRVIYEMSSVGAPDTFLTHKEHISNLRLVEEEELHQDRDLLLIIDKISR